MKYFKRVATALALTTAVIAPSGLVAQAGPPNTKGAGSAIVKSCSGAAVKGYDRLPIGSGGRWTLYYSPAAGGTNCLVVENLKGGKVYMKASILSTTGPERWAWDAGTYMRYAGGAQITGTKSQCVSILVEYERALVALSGIACR